MPKPIMLNDLLHMSQEDINRAKIRFTLHGDGVAQIETYISNPDGVNTDALFWRADKVRYFKVGQIAISLVQLSGDTWFLATIKEVTRELGITNGVNYEGIVMEEYEQFFGRAIITYHKSHQAAVLNAKRIIDILEVQQVLTSIFDGEDFPGYDKVRLSYEQLSVIVNRRKKDWVTALENQKAVYLITDMKSGKQYVGSATGENGMLLQRWTNYISNGHGGNTLLRDVVDDYGMDYVSQNFQYSILENYNARVNKDIILDRESWWKETLGSRAFGLNAN